MQNSFRPVAFRLPLSQVAALADAGAGALLYRWRHGPRLAFGFRLRLTPGGHYAQSRAAETAEAAPRLAAAVSRSPRK